MYTEQTDIVGSLLCTKVITPGFGSDTRDLTLGAYLLETLLRRLTITFFDAIGCSNPMEQQKDQTQRFPMLHQLLCGIWYTVSKYTHKDRPFQMVVYIRPEPECC